MQPKGRRQPEQPRKQPYKCDTFIQGNQGNQKQKIFLHKFVKKRRQYLFTKFKKKELFAEIFLTLAYTRHLDFDDTCHIVTWLKVMLDDSMLIENVW